MRATLGILMVFFVLGIHSAFAQSGHNTIAVIDIQSLLVESQAAQDIQRQVEAQRDALQNEFSKYEEELRSAEQELSQIGQDLPPEEFTQKRQDFEQNLIEKRREALGEKRNLEEALIKASAVLRNEIAAIAADIAEERGFNIILTRQNVVIVDREFDLTEDVMVALNERLKTVKVDF